MSLPKPTPRSAALVTGASAGIGSEIAKLLAARGHNLVLVARRKERLDALADELSEEHGVRAETIACDLGKAAPREAGSPARSTSSGSTSRSSSTTPGSPPAAPFYEADPERELEQVRVLVEAVVVLTRMFSPAMVERGRGGDPQRRLHRRHAADALLGRATRPPRPTC